MEEAHEFLPWFKKKPHLIILSHPAWAYLESGLLSHRESKGYTFIVPTPPLDKSLDSSHIVSTRAASSGMLMHSCVEDYRPWDVCTSAA